MFEMLLETKFGKDPNDFMFRGQLLRSNQEFAESEARMRDAKARGDLAAAAKWEQRQGEIAVAESERLKKQERVWCANLGKFVCLGAVAAATGGTGLAACVAGRAAVMGASMVLDDELRASVAQGDYARAWSHIQDHLPIWGPLRGGLCAVEQGNYADAALQATALGLDLWGLKSGTKGAGIRSRGEQAAKQAPSAAAADSESLEYLIKRDKRGKPVAIRHTQMHHVIHKQFENHPLLRAAGFEVNEASNLYRLPTAKGKAVFDTTRALHQGRHSAKAVGSLKRTLSEIPTRETRWVHPRGIQKSSGQNRKRGTPKTAYGRPQFVRERASPQNQVRKKQLYIMARRYPDRSIFEGTKPLEMHCTSYPWKYDPAEVESKGDGKRLMGVDTLVGKRLAPETYSNILYPTFRTDYTTENEHDL